MFYRVKQFGRALLYRVQQFWRAVFSRVKPEEITWALANLPPEAHGLFRGQAKAEIRHALDVAYDVAQNVVHDMTQDSDSVNVDLTSATVNCDLTSAEHRNLVAAALLHDCGKSRIPIRLWHRVIIVFLQKLPPSALIRLKNNNNIFKPLLETTDHHAAWGCDLARAANLNEAVCALIAEHHAPCSKLGHLLAQADRRH